MRTMWGCLAIAPVHAPHGPLARVLEEVGVRRVGGAQHLLLEVAQRRSAPRWRPSGAAPARLLLAAAPEDGRVRARDLVVGHLELVPRDGVEATRRRPALRVFIRAALQPPLRAVAAVAAIAALAAIAVALARTALGRARAVTALTPCGCAASAALVLPSATVLVAGVGRE